MALMYRTFCKNMRKKHIVLHIKEGVKLCSALGGYNYTMTFIELHNKTTRESLWVLHEDSKNWPLSIIFCNLFRFEPEVVQLVRSIVVKILSF